MQGGIGNSQKRSQQAKAVERPVIGRLGIGLLGIAQICPSFTIRSQTAEGEGFRARVVLYDLLKEKLDKDDETVVKQDIVDIGTFELEKFTPEKGKQGTLIIGDDVHPTFTRAFRDSLSFEKFKKPPLDWEKALRVVSHVHSLQQLGDYWRLLWELSACCPIPYVSGSALPNRVIAEDQRRLESYDFKVIVDGIQLAKPAALRGNPGGYTIRKIDVQSQKVYGTDLVFHGYIVVQEGLQLKPDELRGILIRIKDVAIGYYDQSMLDYRSNEGPRSRWITGEIFVDSGLEDALNIDRDSFNRFHPEFRAIQDYIHKLLRKDIFPRVYEQIEVRSAARDKSRTQGRRRELAKVLSKAVDKPVSLTYVSRSGSDAAANVTVQSKAGKANVRLPAPENLETKRTNQQLASSILALFEVAMREKGLAQQRETFRKLLLELLAHW